MALPTNISTGLVTGQFIVGVIDGADPDQEPDGLPASGTITFTASVPYLPDVSASPNPVTLLKAPIIGILDEEGYLSTPDPEDPTKAAYPGVRLAATDDPDLGVEGWTWHVTYRFNRVNGTAPEIESHSMALVSGETRDLTTAVKVPSSQGLGIEQAEALAAAANQHALDAAASAAETTVSATVEGDDLVMVRRNGESFVAGNVRGPEGPNAMPTRDFIVQELAAEGPVRESLDTESAALVATPGTALAIELSAAIAETAGVNVKSFGATGDGVTDDTDAIKRAIATVAGGSLVFPPGVYVVTDTIKITKNIALAGAGSGKSEPQASAATVLRYNGANGKTVLDYSLVYGAGIKGIFIDGNGKAGTGIRLDRYRSAVVTDLTVRGCLTYGMVVTTSGVVMHDNSMFNTFSNIEIANCPIPLFVDGDTANLCNSCHNTFSNIHLMYTGAYGLLLGNADNNTFLDVMTSRLSGTGYGVGLVGDAAAADGELCRSNYFYHVQGTTFARAGSKNNIIYGYDQENGQSDPVVEDGADLSWTGNAGDVQQRYWSINSHISAPNIIQKNHLTNGNFDVWTYGTSFVNPAPNAFFAPRWKFWYNNTLDTTITREKFVKGQKEVPHDPRYFTKISIGAGTATLMSLTHMIEGADTLSGERVRVSFYAKSSVDRVVGASFKQNFGVGGSPKVSNPISNVSVTTEWQKFSYLVTLADVSTKTFGAEGTDSLDMEFSLDSPGDLMISQFKLERGIKDSTCVLREIPEEELLCSRYAQKVTAQIGTTDTVIPFLNMAKNPTVTGGGSGFTVNGIGTSFIRCFQTTAGMWTLLLRAE